MLSVPLPLAHYDCAVNCEVVAEHADRGLYDVVFDYQILRFGFHDGTCVST